MAQPDWVYFDGMAWPLPDGDLTNRVRYNSTNPLNSDADRARIAATLSAYAQMIADSEKKRRKVLRHLRAALAKS